jgi:hypothetical protein
VFPANLQIIRPAVAEDALLLRKLAAAAEAPPLTGRILIAEVRGVIAAAMSRDEGRTLADPATAPAYLTTVLRLHADALAAFEREPRLAERFRAAIVGAEARESLPLAA